MADSNETPAVNPALLALRPDRCRRMAMLSLINRRAALAHAVGEIKRQEGSVVFRPDREARSSTTPLRNNGPCSERERRAHLARDHVGLPCLGNAHEGGYLGPAPSARNWLRWATLVRRSCGCLAPPLTRSSARPRLAAEFGVVVPVENSTEGVVARLLDLPCPRRCHHWRDQLCWCGTTCCASRKTASGHRCRGGPSPGLGPMPELAEPLPARCRAPPGGEQCRRCPAGGRESAAGGRGHARAPPPSSACTRSRGPSRTIRTTRPGSRSSPTRSAIPPKPSGHDCTSLVAGSS